MRDICQYLSGRSDKNFLGTGNIGVVIQANQVRLIFVQQWREGGLMDWASGSVASWSPDRIALADPLPQAGSRCSHPPSARWVFAGRNDVLGMTMIWKNDSAEEMVVQASFRGEMPEKSRPGQGAEAGFLYAAAPYSDRVPQPVQYVLAATDVVQSLNLSGETYEVRFSFPVEPKSSHQLTIFIGLSTDAGTLESALRGWKLAADILMAVRQDWNIWFNQAIPGFQSSNPFFEKLYYYRWWSLYTKMIFARLGHFIYPAPREGTVAFEGCVSFSGACISMDELRWMRSPDWAFSTAREFFAPQNLNDGYLSNHIWDWGIDGDESNRDTFGRDVPYHSYAVAAFHGALLVHPDEGKKALVELWPQLRSHLEAYPRLFDIDQDGIYETYPWSNAAGQEWTARHLYFNPIPEIFRYARGRTYSPDGSGAAADWELVQKIRQAVVTDPELQWPETVDSLVRLYYATRDHRLATVDQSTYAYRDFKSASSLAALLADTLAEERYDRMAETTRSQIQGVMWDSQDAFFYDVRPIQYKYARVKAVTGFYPFWAQIATRKHLPMLQHLFNPAVFWTEFPLPSLPLDYEKYAEIQKANWTYWNYCTWPRTTCHVVDGLFWAAKTLDISLAGNAALLLDKYTRMHFKNGDVRLPTIAERYDPHTAEPVFENLDYNHSSWIDLVIRHVAGITPTESDEIIIDPVDMGWESFSITNIRYRNHDIDIAYARETGFIVRIDSVVRARTPKMQRTIIYPSQM